MSKKLNKVLVSMISLAMMVLCLNVNVKATTPIEDEFNKFSELKDNTTRYLLVGEEGSILEDVYYYINITAKTKDKTIANIEKSVLGHEVIVAKKAGTTTLTVTAENEGKTVTKKFKIQVKNVLSNSALDSKTNDVVSMTKDSNGRLKILLANGELWNTDKNTYKLTKKSAGNISKYVYGGVYFNEGEYSYKNVTAILRKNKKLTMECAEKKVSVSNVKQLSGYGYLKTNGDYYGMVLKDGKFLTEKKISNVTRLLDDYLLLKDKKLYTISNKKISNLNIKDAKGTTISGLMLTTDNKVYNYHYDFDKNKFLTKFVEKDVKELIDGTYYKTKSGKGKYYLYYEDQITSDNYWLKGYFNFDYTASNEYKLNLNKNLYLNNRKLLTDVTDVLVAPSEKYNNVYLITRTDGSIWRLCLKEKVKLTKVRSGKNKYKRISKPTSVKVKQASKTSAKVSWKAVSGATSYSIYRTTSKTGSYKRVGTTTGTSFINKGLKKGKTYYYKVKANTSKSLYNSDTTNYVKVTIK